MDEIHDDDIKVLYAIIRQSEDAEACYDQKEAIRQIKRLAHLGNPDAVIALDHLSKAPGLHPFLREIKFA
jgi:hypothetical protein